ncbi:MULTISPECIES: outer membrane beta-barrel protein [unclassified Fusobacterium]|uniref:outer membrane beta-barrel protein n=1 Tax=unclassified Fusobacterium TaxID=2648384 RepID=UPI001B8C2E67|nr:MULTISPECIES: outer membrane beta-barrel protein [unclassified Fusobacterium]MBR8702293.1 hypothetical protein [Fusobacterium sp. DD45]MBR8712107.1 hypothetical protein [Fusobacterium sp. DD28]MBR8752689.1 hypothetical protein [Fusobacterium sp. DD26]
MKKILFGLFALSMTAMAAEGTHVYLKAGLDPYGRFKEVKGHQDDKLNKSDRKDIGYEFSVEATQSVLPEVEVGLGLGYQDHGRAKAAKDEDGEAPLVPRFKSVPLYATAKYNLPIESEFHPYLKADLGYSFNMKSSKTYKDDEGEEKLSYKNGMYWGLGAGVEYENFVADLMYKMNYGKVKYEARDEDGYDSASPKINYGRVTLSVGYRFDF